MSKEIKLTQGYVAIVDDEDYEAVMRHKWHASVNGRRVYARTNMPVENKGRRMLHRFIMNPSDDQMVDHINGDPLDNRRSNLRICTSAQNAANSRRRKNRFTSIFKGVSYYEKRGDWLAQICVNDKVIHLGYHKSEVAAGRAYNEAAVKYFGEFAQLNIIPEDWEQLIIEKTRSHYETFETQEPESDVTGTSYYQGASYIFRQLLPELERLKVENDDLKLAAKFHGEAVDGFQRTTIWREQEISRLKGLLEGLFFTGADPSNPETKKEWEAFCQQHNIEPNQEQTKAIGNEQETGLSK